MYILSIVQAYTWLSWILVHFRSKAAAACRCRLSKQDVSSVSSSQQPGPPTQTVYFRPKLELCNYRPLNFSPQPPSGHFGTWFLSTKFALMALSYFSMNLPICCWLKAGWDSGSDLKSTYQKSSCVHSCSQMKKTVYVKGGVICIFLLVSIIHESLFRTLWQLM